MGLESDTRPSPLPGAQHAVPGVGGRRQVLFQKALCDKHSHFGTSCCCQSSVSSALRQGWMLEEASFQPVNPSVFHMGNLTPREGVSILSQMANVWGMEDSNPVLWPPSSVVLHCCSVMRL